MSENKKIKKETEKEPTLKKQVKKETVDSLDKNKNIVKEEKYVLEEKKELEEKEKYKISDDDFEKDIDNSINDDVVEIEAEFMEDEDESEVKKDEKPKPKSKTKQSKESENKSKTQTNKKTTSTKKSKPKTTKKTTNTGDEKQTKKKAQTKNQKQDKKIEIDNKNNLTEQYQYKKKGDEKLITDKPSVPLVMKKEKPDYKKVDYKTKKEYYERFLGKSFQIIYNGEMYYDSDLSDSQIKFEEDGFIVFGKKHSYKGIRIKNK